MTDLDGAARALQVAHADLRVEHRTAAHGREVRVTTASGLALVLDPLGATDCGEARAQEHGRTPTGADVVVEPLWMTPDVEGAAAVLRTLDLVPRLASNGGGWVELAAAGGGLVGVHHSEPAGSGTVLSLQCPDLDALARRLDVHGVPTTFIDETYARTLRLEHPDHPGDVEAQIWVNEVQTDLYGYSRE
ncbi:VOC family protein [Litorihabitans aurantiacus]|uniref:VOC family protein n=1 Tax=Litorihabitans aurantiacus TaxID=1930061 RepID=UPI0024E10F5B|nr:hypothetical protein [Litorihabitans aurantiacus]